ncbi:MAG: outer membrane protein transport protein [Candidatus Aminicenantes bacterium]|nr:outer membrane protein transport protein [Candidatus Aminicenantes bacterium]
MGKKLIRKIVGSLMILLLFSGLAMANGLNLNGLGTKAVAMGGAFIGLADDFSLVYWNPAGAGFLRQPLFGTYLNDLIPTNRYQLTMPPGLAMDAKTKLSHYLGFLAGYYRPLSDCLVLGIGVYTPAGLGANWKGEDFKEMSAGVAYDWTSKIGMISISPLVAWKINDRISVGATFNLNYGMFSLKRWAGEMEMEPGVFVDLGQYEESLHGWGWGLTLGILVKPADWLSAGLTVKTPSTIKFKGTASMFSLGYLGYPDSSEVKRNIKWPWFVGGGLALKPKVGVTLTADLQWTGWSVIKNMTTTYLDPVWMMMMTESGNDHVVMDWKDSLQVRFGLEYKVTSNLALRAGYYSDPSPAPDYSLNILLPSFDFQVAAVGFGYEWKGLSVTWGLEYLSGKKREVTLEELMTAGTLGQAMAGTYRMHLIVPSLSVAFSF